MVWQPTRLSPPGNRERRRRRHASGRRCKRSQRTSDDAHRARAYFKTPISFVTSSEGWQPSSRCARKQSRGETDPTKQNKHLKKILLFFSSSSNRLGYSLYSVQVYKKKKKKESGNILRFNFLRWVTGDATNPREQSSAMCVRG